MEIESSVYKAEHETFAELDTRMRKYEQSLDKYVGSENIRVARMDGRGFSKFTQEHFKKPFDIRFSDIMNKTMCKMIKHSGLNIIYGQTHSDEISIVISLMDNTYNGKERKLITLLSSLASVYFTDEVNKELKSRDIMGGDKSHSKVNERVQCTFDCRLVPLPFDKDAAIEYFRWRAADAKRNSLTEHCYWTLISIGNYTARQAASTLDQMTREQKKELLLKYKITFDMLPSGMVNGRCAYMSKVKKIGFNPVLGKGTETTRNKLFKEDVTYDTITKILDSVIQNDIDNFNMANEEKRYR